MIESIIKLSDTISGRLDPTFFTPRFMSLIHQIEKINHKPLYKIAEISNETWNQKDFFEIDFPYIEIGAIDINTGLIAEVDIVEKSKAPSRAKKIVRYNDIIISTTRPNRGAISIIKANEDIQIASTGFVVIREVGNEILREYLFIVLRLKCCLEQMAQKSSGGNYPAITEEEFKKILIPLPKKEIQQKIVDIYNQAYQNKQKKESEAKALLESIDGYLLKELGIELPGKDTSTDNRFYTVSMSHLFGKRYDPYYSQPYFEQAFSEVEKTSFPITDLKNIATLITSGITPLAGGDSYTLREEGIPFVRSGDVDIDGNIDFENLLYLKPSIHNGKMKSSKLIKDDIMIAIVGATIGQVGIYKYDREANINQAIALVRLKDGVCCNYIKELIKSSIGQLNLDRLKRPVARANINLEEIASIKVILPPLNKQNEIAAKIGQLRIEAAEMRQRANDLLNDAKKEIEKIILG